MQEVQRNGILIFKCIVLARKAAMGVDRDRPTPSPWIFRHDTESRGKLIACLHDQKKSGFFRGRLFPTNQSSLKTFKIALIGWIKAGPLQKPLLF